MINPRKATRKIPPIASGRAGRSRVGLVLVGVRRRGAVFEPGRGGAFEMVLGRGLFFAEGTSFRVVEYLCPFWSRRTLRCARWRGPKIGRASCRERVWGAVVAGAVEKKRHVGEGA